MDKILSYVETYGLSILVISICIIVLIGLLKMCKLFDKIESKDIKKVIYYALDVVLAFAGSAIYFASFNKGWEGYIAYSFAELAVTTLLYALYENFGVRKLVQWLFSVIATWIKKNPDKELSKLVEKIGLTESLDKIQTMIKESEEKSKQEQQAQTNSVEQNTNEKKTESSTVNEIKF